MQPAQGLLPATGETSPSDPFEKEANAESARFALLLQRGHVLPSFAWLMGRSRSNFKPHSVQTYS